MSPLHKTIRATPDHLELARQAICEVHERQPLDDSALESFLRDPSCYLLLATEQNRVVGSLDGYCLRRPDRREPQFLLYKIDVRPESRRKGVGTALLQSFHEQTRSAGANEVWVLTSESNVAAVKLYHKCGFRRSNLDDVMMEKAIL